MNGLKNLLATLESGGNEIHVAPDIARRAVASIQRTLDFSANMDLTIASTPHSAWQRGVGPA